MAVPARKLATWEEVWEGEALDRKYEVLGGEVVEKAGPAGEHSTTQSGFTSGIFGPFSRRAGGGNPGGWWILTEATIEFARHDVLCPDLAGWRRERMPERPVGFPIRVTPDWVCEILSPSTASRDLGPKREVYHAHKVEWYWVVHPVDLLVTVLRWNERAYEVVTTCGAVGRVRLPPFDAVELEAARLFGLDPPDDPPANP